MTVSRDLGRALMRMSARPVPGEVLTAAKLHLLDAIGVGLAASRTAIGEPYRNARPRCAERAAPACSVST